MPRNDFYRQCRLRRPAGKFKRVKGDDSQIVTPLDGSEPPYEEMVSWLPSDIAIVGKTVRIKEFHKDKEWSEGWVVLSVGPKRDGKTIEDNADLWKHQREVSDV